MARQPKQEKQPHLAWRITRTVLDVLGKIILVLLIAVGTVALIAAIAGSIFLSKFKSYVELDIIPKAEEYAEGLELDNISLAQTSIIYYTDPKTGEYRELQQLYGTENRIWVSYDDIPLDLVHAAISIEDKRFPTHKGVDWIRTLAAVKGFAGGSSSFGGSTITQQLIKNLSQEDEVTVDRKVQEIFRALEVEKRYTKSEIMEWYLNTIYLGEGCYGVQSAARVYFGKKVSDLTTAECASLIAITNNPSLYDPYIREENNRERQLTILKEMYAQGYIETEEAYQAAVDQEMVFRNGTYDEEEYTCASCGFTGTRAEYTETDGEYFCPQCGEVNNAVDKNHYYSYFVDTVWRDVVDALVERYGYSELAAEQKLLTGGYKIYATIDPEVQAIVDKVYENLDNVPKTVSVQQLQSAIVVTDNKTGDIVAMAGGVGDKGGSLTLNRATQSKQPAGSSFKPVAVYAPALDAGIITPATVYEDSPLNEDRNWPQNDSRSYSGLCNVLRGLTRSLNTISVKVLNDLGVENSYQFLTQKLGFTTLVDELQIGDHSYTDIALAPLGLGQLTRGVTVREMTQAYGTFPNGGTFREARTFTKVVDPEGKVILDNAQESHTAIGEKADFYINYMLQNAVLDGVYPVSDGKHSRLRLRQGNASLYAVWFGMRPEQLPYATGDVVDTALNLSVYDAPRGAQLSGRIIDLHPAGLGSAMPQQAALVQALRRGTPLTTEQKNLITPARSDIIAVYRELQARRWHAEDLQPLCAKLGEENTGKTLVAVTALEQVGLIAAAEKGGAKVWELVPTAGKKNLADAPILKCLEEM